MDVRPIQTPKEQKAFFEFPWRLYKNDPNWVPPLLSFRRELLDKRKHPAWDYVEGECFGAWRGDQLVGTIMALINHRHNEFHGEQVGWFAQFECYDDPETAHALLETASQWVKARGYNTIRGPQFTTHEECGLLIENFTRPVILMPYNPPYYQQLIESAGFAKAMDIVSMYIDRDLMAQHNTLERFEKIVTRQMQRSNITIREVNTRKLKQEFALFKELYNAAWSKNWGFVPMTAKELDALVASLGTFFDPKLAFFAEVNHQPAGFILSIPDFNEVLHKAYPRPDHPELWTLLKALWYWKVKRIIRGVRNPLMGVCEEYRHRGVDLALLYTLAKALLPSQYNFVDSGWILETNELVKISVQLGNKIYKRHRFYEKKLV